MSEIFQFIISNPWQAVVAAVTGLTSFGAVIKIIGIIIDLFGRTKKKLNKRLDKIEALSDKILNVAANLGIDIIRGNIEKAQEQINMVADKLARVERMEETLTSVLAFIETVKTQWATDTRIQYETIKSHILSEGQKNAPNPTEEVTLTPIPETDNLSLILPIQVAKNSKKKIRLKKGGNE